MAGGRRSSTELATPRLDGRDTSSRNQIATPNPRLLVVYQYRGSSSEESNSDTSQAPTESVYNNTENEEDDEGKHLVETYGSDSEEEA